MGRQPSGRGGRKHTILPNFPKNCMELKEFGPGGASLAPPPLDPPLARWVPSLVSLGANTHLQVKTYNRYNHDLDIVVTRTKNVVRHVT